MSFSAQWQSPKALSSPTSSPTVHVIASTPPTSAPKSSSNKERRLKLRASCDACAASKVKCSKNRPTCTRCSANGMQCIYGVSRKHGKPGRTRKKNPDGTPFVKASKQRPSPDGSEFGKFRLSTEPMLQPLRGISETGSNWSSNWSSTPSLPGTPDFEFEMTPEPFYMDTSDLTFLDDILLPTSQPEPDTMQAVEPELTFRDPFAKRQSSQLDRPNSPALEHFVGDDSVNQISYTSHEAHAESYFAEPHPPSPQNSKCNRVDSYNPMRVSLAMPSSHCCYTLAYSTLESLSVIGSDATNAYSSTENKSLDNVLSITRLAVHSVQQLLSCPCSSDPHLAMLYASITSKLLTWYRITAGVDATTSPTGPRSMNNTPVSRVSGTSSFSSPLSPRTSRNGMGYSMAYQPLHFGAYQADVAEQQRLRKQVVLRDLQSCGQLVDALANWRGDGTSEQGKFLYEVLGTWLKSELYKATREVEGAYPM
ncbi:hypothetical protein CC86DRAFT_117380 [Ophiobolus disseminans]|uniref:Zn(2)-C6 fungal-type domain-containing protein n=1 Tax=Ophiobolus disseminans TaxID=1469910 RepID=A0A6A6ZJ11_9PLEO|nr:hypothetical protein CC86DRAFT_117380 [Ophiobolus disseminans]